MAAVNTNRTAAFYRRLVAARKPPKLALIALMRKMLNHPQRHPPHRQPLLHPLQRLLTREIKWTRLWTGRP
jgi:hypothetical protein